MIATTLVRATDTRLALKPMEPAHLTTDRDYPKHGRTRDEMAPTQFPYKALNPGDTRSRIIKSELWLKVISSAGRIAEPLEHAELRWCDADQARDLLWAAADGPVLRELFGDVA